MGRRGRREGVSIWGRTNTRERARGANFFDRIRVLLNDFEICEALRCERAHQEPFHKTFCHKQPVEDRHKTMHKTALSEGDSGTCQKEPQTPNLQPDRSGAARLAKRVPSVATDHNAAVGPHHRSFSQDQRSLLVRRPRAPWPIPRRKLRRRRLNIVEKATGASL